MTRDEMWLLKEKYEGRESEAFAADRRRLQSGEPLAYLIGHVPFLDVTIHLDSHPLIPRSETEFWVEKAIADIKRTAPRATRILDLCAGSGCIGVAVAHAIESTHVTFAELNRSHLSTIAKNLTENGIDCQRYQVFQSDLFENITGTFDFILSNPPYIDPALDRTETSVKNFEPHEALYGGTNGLELIERIIRAARDHLNAAGKLYLEHEPEQTENIMTLAGRYQFQVATHTDQYGISRYSVLRVAE